MKTPDLNDLIDQLEEAQEAGEPLRIEDVCNEHPELIEPLRKKWASINKFDHQFCTHRETTEEVDRKLSVMYGELNGRTLIMQTRLSVDELHDGGGLGEVYEATDEGLSRKLAIKVLQSNRQITKTHVEDFERETQIIGRLNHPGIVSILGSGQTIEGQPFYAMPFLDRGNLRKSTLAYHDQNRLRLNDSDKEFRELIYRLMSVCKAIAYAHSRGIVHRDLKPENVMLGKYGEAVVIDWGCATRVELHERFRIPEEPTVHIPGETGAASSGGMTLRYASPEQHGGKTVGPESDIYSLGAMLYTLLTGKSPFENMPPEQIRAQVMAGKLEPPEQVKSGVPRALSAICKKAMAVDPHERYETALAMADDLERYLSDASVSVCRDSLPTRMARLVRRNRTASLVVLAMLLLGSTLLTLALAGQSVLAHKAESSAAERLQLAAKMASFFGGFEIERRMRRLESNASKPLLISTLSAIEANPDDRQLWSTAQTLLYEFKDELTLAGVELESMFINDSRGIQIARAPKSEESLGKNFAYRNYFHGLAEDFDPLSPEFLNNPPPPANRPVVSNVYVSTNPDRSGEFPIKTALSVPVYGNNSDGEKVIVGRLGASFRVNDLQIFEHLSEFSVDAYLVETGDYAWGTGSAQGLILDRTHDKSETFAVPVASSGEDDKNSEAAVQDAMPRLPAKFFVREEPGALLEPIRIPYRDDYSTAWAVYFTAAEPSGESLDPQE